MPPQYEWILKPLSHDEYPLITQKVINVMAKYEENLQGKISITKLTKGIIPRLKSVDQKWENYPAVFMRQTY